MDSVTGQPNNHSQAMAMDNENPDWASNSQYGETVGMKKVLQHQDSMN